MKRLLQTALLLAASLLPAHAIQQPKWMHDAVFYQIYPSSYMDTDGNGIGDLPGIISKLDYIQSLGATAIWLNPAFESGWTDGGYDVIDYYRIDPRFGTNTDLKRLTSEAHKRGIKVCMDLVVGHSSDQCKWFKQSWNERDGHYSDFYIWFDEADEQVKKEGIYKLDPNVKDYTMDAVFSRYVEANAPRGKYYEKNYYPSQPALNYGYYEVNPNHPWEQPVTAPGPQATRREVRQIMQFWFDKGVDGFRVDMASSLVKNDPEKKGTMALWHEMREWMSANYPDCVLIAEWGNAPQAMEAQFNVDFLIHIGTQAYGELFWEPGTEYVEVYPKYPQIGKGEHCYFNRLGGGSIGKFMEVYQNFYSKTKGGLYIALPSSNHDFQRPNFGNRNTTEQLKVSMMFFTTMPGVPFIYYGDEIGMKTQLNLPSKEGSSNRSGCRTPMQWTTGQNAGFSTAAANQLFLPVDTENGSLTVETEEKDPNSMLNYTRNLLKFRKEHSAMGNDGDWELLSNIDQPYPMVYKRTNGQQTYIVVLNPSEKAATTSISLDGNYTLVFGDALKSSIRKNKGNTIVSAKGFAAQIYEVK